jgi:hypothetical protein
MDVVMAIVAVAAGLLVVAWLMGGSRLARNKGAAPQVDDPDAPFDPAELGAMVGLLGGSTEDAAKAQYAVSRLHAQLGRTPTRQEAATAISMVITSGV